MRNRRFFLMLYAVLSLFSCDQHSNQKSILPTDELSFRLGKITNRINHGELPTITKDFLLAEVTLDPRFERRFTNFSGDQLGRYLSAMSQTDNAKQSIDIHDLVKGIISNQKKDGRFGADILSFNAVRIEGPQMALLWGNGRLLNGLLDYYEKYPDRKEALASAQRLGDFLEGVTFACTRPEIIERFKTMGALGFICFTQITEGMVKLYKATGVEKYKSAAEHIYPLLPEPGNQHSHGFLTTLRGVVMLYEVTNDPIHLKYVEKIFDQIIASKNYMISGGVPEFFNFHNDGEETRDEGCSEADFFILCLQLWKATGKSTYLDKAEYTLVNHMLYNQFKSGDFGHHVIKEDFGFVTSPFQGKSWWCCNYHGLQALLYAQKTVVTKDDKLRKINLFYETNWKDDQISFELKKNISDRPSYHIPIRSVSDETVKIAIRHPYWSSSTVILINGKDAKTVEKDGYFIIENRLKQGDDIQFTFKPILKLVDRNRNEISLSGLSDKPIQAALIYGPWLMSVDDINQNLFMTELSQNNIIYLPRNLPDNQAKNSSSPKDSFIPEAYLTFTFLKEGTSQKGSVVLRPISEMSFQCPANVRFWLNFARQE